MYNYIGAIFFDIDGTLVDERAGIFKPTAKTIEAIEKLKEKGYLIGVDTGRGRRYVPDLGVDFDCYITCNGTVCEVNGKEIFNDYIEQKELDELVEFMEENDIGYAFDTAERCYVQEEAQESFRKWLGVFNIDMDKCFEPLTKTDGLKVNKVLAAFKSEEQLKAMQEKIGSRFNVLRHHKNLSADVGKYGMNKARGILEVINYLDIKLENTYAFGDDGNDYEMIRDVGFGVAMTPHIPALAEVADYITGSVEDEGIYNALKHIGLI